MERARAGLGIGRASLEDWPPVEPPRWWRQGEANGLEGPGAPCVRAARGQRETSLSDGSPGLCRPAVLKRVQCQPDALRGVVSLLGEKYTNLLDVAPASDFQTA